MRRWIYIMPVATSVFLNRITAAHGSFQCDDLSPLNAKKGDFTSAVADDQGGSSAEAFMYRDVLVSAVRLIYTYMPGHPETFH